MQPYNRRDTSTIGNVRKREQRSPSSSRRFQPVEISPTARFSASAASFARHSPTRRAAEPAMTTTPTTRSPPSALIHSPIRSTRQTAAAVTRHLAATAPRPPRLSFSRSQAAAFCSSSSSSTFSLVFARPAWAAAATSATSRPTRTIASRPTAADRARDAAEKRRRSTPLRRRCSAARARGAKWRRAAQVSGGGGAAQRSTNFVALSVTLDGGRHVLLPRRIYELKAGKQKVARGGGAVDSRDACRRGRRVLVATFAASRRANRLAERQRVAALHLRAAAPLQAPHAQADHRLRARLLHDARRRRVYRCRVYCRHRVERHLCPNQALA